MHELSIAMAILERMAEEAERHGAERVVGVRVRWGPLSGVVKEALASAYEIAREDSPFAETELVIEEAPVLAYCPTCGEARGVVSIQRLACRACGTPTPTVVSGRELQLVGIEIE